ncbi:MAG: uroporphyrinogen-III synthase [Ilumatobacteraceae bacterium]|jgi:uroporphyrinogen-III synthase|nr:uroporphyrinogen-III synthase [Ilumatobacteraceae bacterium]
MTRKLSNCTVVVTRAAEQSADLTAALEAHGVAVVEMPLIAIDEPEDDGAERDRTLHNFTEFEWIVVTSPNGAGRVRPFFDAHGAAGDFSELPKVAAVGLATERALGHPAQLTADPARASVLIEEFPEGRGHVLVVQGERAGNEVEVGLRAKGWSVTRVNAYRTVTLEPTFEQREDVRTADAVVFASGSAVQAWFDSFGVDTPPVVASIGPVTTRTANDLGMHVSTTAEVQTVVALADAVVSALLADEQTS